MKQCPKCFHTYTDVNLNFCLEDGEMLTAFASEPPPARYADDPPTMVMDPSRVTNPSNWPNTPPASGWQQQSPVPYQQQGVQNNQFGTPAFVQKADQTLPTVSLALGIISVVLICCYGGIWLGLPAAIVGFLGMRNADADPTRYGGRGMAIAGIVLGVISFLSAMIFVLFAIVSR